MLLPSRSLFAADAVTRAMLLAGATVLLSSCASMEGGLFPSFSGDKSEAQQIASEPLDPMNADPMQVDPLDAPPPTSNAASGSGSQLVPLGSLSASDMAAQPARRTGPAPLIPPSGATAPPPAPVAQAPAAPAPAPAAPAVVLTPPPSMAQAPTPAQPESQLVFEPAKRTSSAKVLASPRETAIAADVPPQTAEFLPQPAAALPPPVEAREFIPAQIGASEPMMGGRSGGPKLTVGDNNIIRRFQILSKLLDEGLITQEEHDRRRAANIGALLQYSKEPPGLGLDRPVPAPGAISARLQALGRSLEMRAITSRQHELERNTILNSLLPERPDPRAPRTPPPADMFALADAAGRLAYIRDEDLISEGEFDTERSAMDRVMRGGDPIEKRPVSASTGTSSSSGAAKALTAAAKPAATGAASAAKPDAPAAPDTLSGPVLHLASFRSVEGARSAFEQAKAKNPAVFTNLRMEARKANIPGQGVFYRLLVGPFPSLGDAEAACVEMKKVDQFCRPTPDGS